MRLFVALEIDEDLRIAAAAARTRLEKALRLRHAAPRLAWVRSEHLHVTLRFIGQGDQFLASRVCDALQQSSLPQKRRLRWSNLGVFPSARRPRVLWLGPEDDEGLRASLDELQRALASVLGPPEAATWHPHVTLARVRDAANLQHWQPILDEAAPPPLDAAVTAVTLFESRLSPGGPAYTPLCRLPLALVR